MPVYLHKDGTFTTAWTADHSAHTDLPCVFSLWPHCSIGQWPPWSCAVGWCIQALLSVTDFGSVSFGGCDCVVLLTELGNSAD